MSYVKPAPGYVDAARAEQLLEKWASILDYTSDTVRPLSNDHTRYTTAQLLENQEQYCLKEANLAGSGNVFGGFTSNAGAVGNSDQYAAGDYRLPKVLIPMIRRTFPELITNEIVGVQPMAGPVGLAFALRYRYDSNALGSEARSGTWGADLPLGSTTGPDLNTGGSNTPVGYRTAKDYFNAGGVAKINTGGSDVDSNLKEAEVGYQQLNTAFTGVSSANLAGASNVWEFDQGDQGVAAIMSAFEMTSNIPQLTLEFAKTSVEAGTRRLAAKWSVELEQDLKNMNGLDIDNELTQAMSYEIQAEIDREMIMRMVQTCLNAGAGKGYSYWAAWEADGRWLGERNRTFYAKVIVEANRIAVRNRRGAANFIIATPRVCAILEMLPEFQWMPMNGNVNTQPVGIAKVGTVGGRFQVYRDTRTEAQKYDLYARSGNPASTNRNSGFEYALLGYKGAEYYDTGIVYCPYIPVMIQRTIAPNDFTPRVGLLTRYGVVDNLFGADLYYHVIIVRGLSGDDQALSSNVGGTTPGSWTTSYL
jgi:hypothetical protein